MQSGRRNYFTLVELLVVIAVITVLAGLLLPALSHARRIAMRTVDLNNQMQSGLVLMQYANDFRGRYPLHPSTGQYGANNISGNDGPPLVETLSSHMEDYSIWDCVFVPTTKTIDDPANDRWACYSNLMYFAGRKNPDFGLGVDTPNRTSHPNATSSMPILMCKVQDWLVKYGIFFVNHTLDESDLKIMTDNPSNGRWGVASISQVEGACMTFMDGHSKWVRGSDLEIVGMDHWGTNTVNTWSVLP